MTIETTDLCLQKLRTFKELNAIKEAYTKQFFLQSDACINKAYGKHSENAKKTSMLLRSNFYFGMEGIEMWI